jgi:hypothetical protein
MEPKAQSLKHDSITCNKHLTPEKVLRFVIAFYDIRFFTLIFFGFKLWALGFRL